jgi:hypothetical protein
MEEYLPYWGWEWIEDPALKLFKTPGLWRSIEKMNKFYKNNKHRMKENWRDIVRRRE